jgi:hypothetical protein
MLSKRLGWWLVLLALAFFALAGCAPRTGQGETAAQAGADQLAVDLPALVIDVDSEGNFTTGGIPLAALGASFGAAGLDTLKLSPAQVALLTNANVQHIQINNLPDGLKILVNGEEIPTLVWDAKSLAALQSLVGQLGTGLPPLVQQLLPLLDRLGVGVTVRFPPAQGAELIPLAVAGESSSASAAQAGQQQFLASVGTPPHIVVPIQYAADGSWRAAGMSEAEWITLTGQSALESLRLPASLIADLTNAGVKTIVVSTDPDGLHVTVNDQALPYLAWGEGRLSHALTLAASAGVLGEQGGAAANLAPAIEALLPMVTGSQVELRLTLPG